MQSDSNKTDLSPEEEARARILGETAKIAWKDLQRIFAAGKAVAVTPDLDLVEVAYQMSVDNQTAINAWMNSAEVGVVTDAQAAEWLEANALMWACVVKPWVLVQPILQKGKR